MATSVISSVIKNPAGTAVASVPVICRLKPSNGFRSNGSEVTSRVTTTSDVNGAYSFTLERNADITPANTWYEIEEQIPDTNGGAQVWAISVGTSNQTLADARITPTLDSGYGTYLTEARARLIFALLGTPITTGTSNIFTGHQYFKSGRPWVDVMAFGAVGDGSTDDTAAIQAAADAAAAFGAGAVLYFPPPGSFYKTSGTAIFIGSNTSVLGSGWHCVVKRASSGTVFNAEDTDNVSFANIAIDCAATGNFATCIDADKATNFRVENCRLINTGSTSSAWTIHAVVWRSGTDCRIANNRCEGTQIKTGANSAWPTAKRLYICDNLLTNSFNFAISCVLDDSHAAAEEVTIARNETINAESGGIYVGQDGTAGIVGGSFKRLSVIDNRVLGDSAQSASYIQASLCDTSEQWRIDQNHIVGVSATGSRPGIRVAENDSASSCDGLSVCGNQIDGLGHHAIQVENAINVHQFVIANNYGLSAAGTTGNIRVVNPGTTHSYGVIANNACELIHVEGTLDVLVTGNNVRGGRPDFETGAITCIAGGGQAFGLLASSNNVNDSSQDGMSFSGAGTFSGSVLGNRFQQIVKLGIRGLPSTVACRNNSGFVTENSGTGAIASGATSATITHGLGYTPSAYDIAITTTNSPTNDPGHMWVSAPGSTTFVVNCRADPGASTATFSWAVRKV